MSPMMAPSMIDLLDTRRLMETSCPFFSSREAASPGWRTSKKKRLDAAAEASLQPRTACPGTKIAPRQSVCHHHDGAPHGTSRSRMRHCSPTAPQAGAPVNARYFCTSPCGRHGNGHWAQPVWQCQRGSWWFRRHRAGLRRLPYGRCNGHRRKHHICRSFPENRRWDTQAWLTSQGWSDTVRQ